MVNNDSTEDTNDPMKNTFLYKAKELEEAVDNLIFDLVKGKGIIWILNVFKKALNKLIDNIKIK